MSFPIGGKLVFACALAVAAAGPSLAQSDDVAAVEPAPLDLTKLDPAIDWSALNWDASSLVDFQGKAITIVPTRRESLTKWNRAENRDGSSAVTVNRALPAAWDTKVGVDFAVPAAPSPLTTPERLLAGSSAESTGVAWASTTAPALNLPLGWDKASVDARFDPLQDQSTLGTRFSRSLPFGQQMSLTMQSGFAVTHHDPLPSETADANVFDTEGLAKLNFLATGTSIGAGSRKSSVDDVWLNSFVAEQKLLGGLSVAGSVTETLDGPANKSLTAGFKRNW